MRRGGDREPLACVLGEMNLVAALGRAGIRSAVAVPRDSPVCWSRHVVDTIDKGEVYEAPDDYVERLVMWARRQSQPPVLYYEHDGGLLMVSRHRDRLATVFRFVVPDADLVEDLTDKARFARLSARLGLPAPAATILSGQPGDAVAGLVTDEVTAAADALRFPVVVKPATHAQRFGLSGKATRVASPDDLVALWRRIERPGLQVLVQELVPGPETQVESYHAYVDASGEVVAEFTGKKIRTKPDEFGYSTRLRITDCADVRAMGRAIVEATALRGVCKIDLKRDDDGRLWLLEINPRFNLWHNPGAAAGVNLPALVYADLTGTPRPAIGPLRPGVTWIDPFRRHAGEPLRTWFRTVMTSDTLSTGQWSDPLPLLRMVVAPSGSRRPQAARAMRAVRRALR